MGTWETSESAGSHTRGICVLYTHPLSLSIASMMITRPPRLSHSMGVYTYITLYPPSHSSYKCTALCYTQGTQKESDEGFTESFLYTIPHIYYA